MPVTSKSARVPASAKPATKIAPRLVGQALNLRAEGQSRVMIAWRVRLPVKVVTDLLRSARMAGDARALTDAEALAVADGPGVVERLAGVVAEPIVLAPPPVPMLRRTIVDMSGPVGSLDPARLDPAGRLRVVDELHARADRAGGRAAAGLRHVADLYLHCPTFYPNYRVGSDGLPARMMPPEVSTSFGNAGLACAMA